MLGFMPENLKFQGNKCTQEEKVFGSTPTYARVSLYQNTLRGISISHYLLDIMIHNKSFKSFSEFVILNGLKLNF